jgi:hypothetical protein
VDGPADKRLVHGSRVARWCAGAARGRVEPNQPTTSLSPARVRAGAPATQPLLSARAPVLLSFVRDSEFSRATAVICGCFNPVHRFGRSGIGYGRPQGIIWGRIHALCCFVGEIPNQ